MVRRAWALVVILGAGLVGCTAAPPAAPDDLCAIFLERPEWHEASQRSRERWGVAESTQLAFIYQESRFVADARPPRRRLLGFIPAWRRSNAYGYGQVKDGTWSDYRRATSNPRASRLDFAAVATRVKARATRYATQQKACPRT